MSDQVKISGTVRTSNPATQRGGNEAELFMDKVGRPVLTMYQVRDLVSTGRAVLTRAQESTVISGVSSTYLDLVQVTVSNSSTVAQTVDIRLSTGANIEDTIAVGASTTISKQYLVPLPASESGTAITAQNSTGGEISDSPVTVTAQAINNA